MFLVIFSLEYYVFISVLCIDCSMYEEYKKEPKNPESLIGEDVGYCFFDSHNIEKCDVLSVEGWNSENQYFTGKNSFLEDVRVTPEAIRRYYHTVYNISEMLNDNSKQS